MHSIATSDSTTPVWLEADVLAAVSVEYEIQSYSYGEQLSIGILSLTANAKNSDSHIAIQETYVLQHCLHRAYSRPHGCRDEVYAGRAYTCINDV
jgi:hypothetical protein